MRQDPNRALEWTKIYPVQRASIANLSLADAGRLLLLLLYCAEKVNGGVIEGARNWTRKQWKNETLLDEIPRKNQPNFWHFSQENLIVDAYDAEAEKAALSKRKGGIKGREKQLKSAGYPAGYPTGDTDTDTDEEGENSVVVDRAQEARRQAPVTFDELFEFLQAEYPDMPQEQIRKCADDYLRLGKKTNWTHSTGEPIHSWQATARGFAEKRLRRYSKRSGSGGGNARSRAEAEEREKRRAEILEELEGVWPADAQQS